MLNPTTLAFLRDLKANNNKPWFDENRPVYETAKGNFVNLLTYLINSLNQVDPGIAGAQLEPKKCLFRINRDVRFSANKAPYKDHFGAWFNKGGKAMNTAGYYLHLEPGNTFVAGGLYMPDAPLLATIRQEIDYNLAQFEAILNVPAFQKTYGELSREDALQRPPKGYAADNPAIEYLKLKSFTASHKISDKQLIASNLSKQILDSFTVLQPLIAFLNTSL